MKFIKYGCVSLFTLLPLLGFATEIITFKPTFNPDLPTKSGSCWTRSNATARNDAWRCSIGNEIVDPCFTTNKNNVLICPLNFADRDKWITLKLTEPLPLNMGNDAVTKQPALPFGLQLDTGQYCFLYTGAASVVNYQHKEFTLHWGCDNPDGDKLTQLELDSLKKVGDDWYTQMFITNQNGKIIGKKNHKVEKIWQ